MKTISATVMSLGLLAAGLATPAPAAAPNWVKVIPVDLAHEAANAAFAACRKLGAHPTVGVMDPFGQMKVLLVDDNATLMGQKAVVKTLYLALMLPSSTATVYGRPEPYGPPEIGPSSSVFDHIAPGMTLDAPGAIPITVNKVVVGAIGVAGSPTGAMDDQCAKAGIAKIQDRLK